MQSLHLKTEMCFAELDFHSANTVAYWNNSPQIHVCIHIIISIYKLLLQWASNCNIKSQCVGLIQSKNHDTSRPQVICSHNDIQK
jgi:hypothetical protein